MKIKNIKKILYAPVLLVAGSILILSACTEDDSVSGGGILRMFSVNSISVQSLETEVRLTWDASLFTNDITEIYTAQVSEDSLFASADAILLEKTTDSTGIVFTDAELAVRKKYYVRVKANAYEDRPESYWSESKGFKITGIQLLHPIYEPYILPTQVTAEWDVAEGVTHFLLQEYELSEDETVLIGDPIQADITTDEANAGVKVITGLEPNTRYLIDLYKSNVSVGYRSFKTKQSQEYTVVLNPGDDIVTIVNNSVDGDVIALNPGEYDANGSGFQIYNKNITILSTSSNPEDTKIDFKEFTLKDNGAGITLKGLELDGENSAAYLINLTSSNNNGDSAAFADVLVENCIVHSVTTSAYRANRGPDGGYSMSNFTISYSYFYDFPGSNYGFLHLDELVFDHVTLENSTFYNAGDIFIRFRQAAAANPNGVISVDYCTINGIGTSGNFALLDTNSIQVNFNFSNSILANIPRAGGTAQSDMIRLLNAAATATISYNNFFALTTGAGVPVVIPSASNITTQGNSEVDLGWTTSTSDFTLPSGSSVLTGSSTGGPIGDPRWWY